MFTINSACSHGGVFFVSTAKYHCDGAGSRIRREMAHENNLDSKHNVMLLKPLQTATNLNLSFLSFLPYFLLLLLLNVLRLEVVVKR